MKTIITSLVGVSVLLFSCGNNVSSSTDSAEPISKQTTLTETEIKIGTQIWATKNLDVSTFRNGDTIPEAKTNEEWTKAGKEGKPAWCYYYYDFNSENGKKYGKLYNWYAVNDPRVLAPNGWHVPTDVEWTVLTDYLGGEAVAGTKMKNSSGWNDFEGKTGNGTNESGFTGSPGGYRSGNGNGLFDKVGYLGGWWSSSEGSTDGAWGRDMLYLTGNIYRGNAFKGNGLSVRCLRD